MAAGNVALSFLDLGIGDVRVKVDRISKVQLSDIMSLQLTR